MAATNRDVELGIKVVTAGTDTVERLRKEVEELAKQGGAAAPEFQRLSSELETLGQQSQLLETVTRLASEIDSYSIASNSAAKTTEELKVKWDAAAEAAKVARAAQDQIKTSLVESQDAMTKARIALDEYRNSNKAAIGTTDEYKSKVISLNKDVIGLRKAIADKSAALRDAKQTTKEAEDAESKLAGAYKSSAKDLNDLTTTLSKVSVEQQGAINGLRQLGVETESLRDAELGLVVALADVQQEFEQNVRLQERAAQAAKDAAIAAEKQAVAEKQAAEDYRRWWSQALYGREQAELKLAASQKAIADESARAGRAMQDALGTVGVRTVRELELEIERVRASLKLLGDSGTLTGNELAQATTTANRRIKELELQIREATGSLTLMDKASSMLSSTVGQFAALYSVVEVAQRLATSFWEATKRTESLRLALGQIYGSSTTAAAQINALRETANRAGVAVGDISEAFVKFSASSNAAGISVAQTNALFQAITQSAGTLGLSGDKVNHILDALSQMAGKGVVSMEELRQQLGDSLPGAMSLAAKGLGLTDQELIKLVESGGLLAKDLFPALTQSLKSMQGEVNTTASAWSRFRNFVDQAWQTFGDAGVVDALKGALTGLGVVVGGLAMGFSLLVESIGVATRSIGAFTGTLVGGGGIKAALAAVGEEFDKGVNRQTEFARAFQNLVTGANTATTAIADHGEVQKALTASQLESLQATKNNTVMTIEHGVAVAAAAEQAKLAGKDWVRLGVDLASLTKAQENSILVAEKSVKAREEEGKAAVNLAKASGDETAARNAAVLAAESSAAATSALLQVREKALAQQIAYRDALLDEIKRIGDSDGSRLKSLDSINQRIAAMAAETERTKASADEAHAHALALGIESEKLKDNAGNLAALTVERNTAKAALEELIRLEEHGAEVSDLKAAAQERLVKVEALYRDALNDVAEAAKRKVDAIKSELDVTVAKIDLEKATLEAEKAAAIARGDTVRVAEINIKLKEIEVKLARAKMEALAAEAKVQLAAVEADKAALEAAGQLTTAKRAELDARIAAAQVKQIEAEAAKERIKIQEQELSNLKNFGDASLDAAQKMQQMQASALKAADGISAVGTSAVAATGKVKALADGVKRVGDQFYNAQGFASDEKGNTIAMGGDLTTRTGIFNFLKSAGVTDENVARSITNEFANASGEITYFNNPGQMKYGGAGSTISQALLKAAEQYTFSGAGASSGMASQQAMPQTATPAAAPTETLAQAQTTHVIRIEAGGKSTSVTVGSEQDAATIKSILGQLAQGKAVSL